MTESQKRLRELIDRQSKDRQKAIELSRVDSLTDEQRTELDTIETRAADTERQLRAARLAVEDEDKTKKVETRDEPDAELRARIELRSRARVGDYLSRCAHGASSAGCIGRAAAGCRTRRDPV